ncbi:MAG: DUF3168 domain-containing protein [Gemmatimonadota bacterium]
MYAANALQAALVSALNDGTSLDWYDHVPPGTQYPYGEVGHITEAPEDLHDGDGSGLTATLHIWSNAPGTKATNDVLADVDDTLHHGTLTVSGARVVEVYREFTQVRKEGEDPDTGRPLRHGIARYRFSLEETS